MKNIFILILGIISSNVFAQKEIYYRPFELEQSMIYNKKLYTIDDSLSNTVSFIREYDLENNELPLLTENLALVNIFYPFCWDILKNKGYSLSAFGRRYQPSFHINKFDLGILDSIQLKDIAEKHAKEFEKNFGHLPEQEQINIALKDITSSELYLKNRVTSGLPPIKGFLKEYFLAPRRGKQKPRNVSDEEYKRLFTFDFIALDTNQIEFYFRDPNQITRWEYSFLPQKDNYRDQWKEIVTYVKDSVTTFPDPYYNGMIPSKENLVFNAIADSTFFEGHFKVIPQGNERFAINLNHGAIYHFGDKKIQKIGQIDLANYNRKLLGKKRFVYDKDNNEIIFFAPVTWEDNDLPKPRLKIMNEAEMKEKFKYVMD